MVVPNKSSSLKDVVKCIFYNSVLYLYSSKWFFSVFFSSSGIILHWRIFLLTLVEGYFVRNNILKLALFYMNLEKPIKFLIYGRHDQDVQEFHSEIKKINYLITCSKLGL